MKRQRKIEGAVLTRPVRSSAILKPKVSSCLEDVLDSVHLSTHFDAARGRMPISSQSQAQAVEVRSASVSANLGAVRGSGRTFRPLRLSVLTHQAEASEQRM